MASSTSSVLSVKVQADGSDARKDMTQTSAAVDKFGTEVNGLDLGKGTREMANYTKQAQAVGKQMQDTGGRSRDLGESFGNTASNSAQAAGGLGDLGGALSSMGGPLGGVGAGMEALAPAIMGVTGASDLLELVTAKLKLGQAKQAVTTAASTAATAAQTAATTVATAATAAFNAVMAVNPVVLVVIAIAALVGLLVLAYKKSDTFRGIVDGLWSSVQRVAGAIAGGFGAALQFLVKWVPIVLAVLLPFIGIPILIAQHFNTIGPLVASAFSTAYGKVTEWIGKILTFVKGVPGKILEAFKDIGSSIASAIAEALNSVLHLPLKIPQVRIGAFGKYVTVGGQTLIPRLNAAAMDDVEAARAWLTPNLLASAGGSPSFVSDAGGATGTIGGAGVVVNVIFDGVVGDPVAVAEQIKGILRADDIRLGVAA